MKNIYSFKGLTAKFKKNINFIFILLLLALLVMEGLVVRRSLIIAWAGNNQDVGVKIDPRVKVNFSTYDQVVKRIQGADSFAPSNGPAVNPFGVK